MALGKWLRTKVENIGDGNIEHILRLGRSGRWKDFCFMDCREKVTAAGMQSHMGEKAGLWRNMNLRLNPSLTMIDWLNNLTPRLFASSVQTGRHLSWKIWRIRVVLRIGCIICVIVWVAPERDVKIRIRVQVIVFFRRWWKGSRRWGKKAIEGLAFKLVPLWASEIIQWGTHHMPLS